MTPPSLETAREILADAAAKARAGVDPFGVIAAAAIDVVLDELDRRGPRDMWAAGSARGDADGAADTSRPATDHPCQRPGALLEAAKAIQSAIDRVVNGREGHEPGDVTERVRGTLACWSDEERAAAKLVVAPDHAELGDREAAVRRMWREVELAIGADHAPPTWERWHEMVTKIAGNRQCEQSPTVAGLGATSQRVMVTTREQAIALFGRRNPLADAPLPFEMVGGTPVAVPTPGAQRVLCGMPIDGEACCLRYGHDGDHEPHRNQDGGRAGHVTDLRLQEISEALTVDDEMRSMADELQERRAQPSRDRNELAACCRAAGGDRRSDERVSEYITRLRRAAGQGAGLAFLTVIPVGSDPASPPIDIKTVRVIARGMGYGRMMKLVEELWRDAAGDGSEFTVGPSASLLVQCVCARGGYTGECCGWCEGTQRVTQRVRNAIEAMNVDEAGGTMSAGARASSRTTADMFELGSLVRVVRGEHAGFIGRVVLSDDLDLLDHPNEWLRVRRDAQPYDVRLFETHDLERIEGRGGPVKIDLDDLAIKTEHTQGNRCSCAVTLALIARVRELEDELTGWRDEVANDRSIREDPDRITAVLEKGAVLP